MLTAVDVTLIVLGREEFLVTRGALQRFEVQLPAMSLSLVVDFEVMRRRKNDVASGARKNLRSGATTMLAGCLTMDCLLDAEVLRVGEAQDLTAGWLAGVV